MMKASAESRAVVARSLPFSTTRRTSASKIGFAEMRTTLVDRVHDVTIDVDADDLDALFGKHRRGRQPDVTKANYRDPAETMH